MPLKLGWRRCQDSRSRSRKKKDSRSRSKSQAGHQLLALACVQDKAKRPEDYGVGGPRESERVVVLRSEVDTMKITDDDAAFILGKGGKTKAAPTCCEQLSCTKCVRNGSYAVGQEKIARVSKAEIATWHHGRE